MAPRENPHCEQPQSSRLDSRYREQARPGVDYGRSDILLNARKDHTILALTRFLELGYSKDFDKVPLFLPHYKNALFLLGVNLDLRCSQDKIAEITKGLQSRLGLVPTGNIDKQTVVQIRQTLQNRIIQHGQVIDMPKSKPIILSDGTAIWGKYSARTKDSTGIMTMKDTKENIYQGVFREGRLVDGTIMTKDGTTFIGKEKVVMGRLLLEGKLFRKDGTIFQGFILRNNLVPYSGILFDRTGKRQIAQISGPKVQYAH